VDLGFVELGVQRVVHPTGFKATDGIIDRLVGVRKNICGGLGSREQGPNRKAIDTQLLFVFIPPFEQPSTFGDAKFAAVPLEQVEVPEGSSKLIGFGLGDIGYSM